MDVDAALLPNELALFLSEKCQKWTYTAYSGEYEATDIPRNPAIDRTYDTRLDREIRDIQSKIQSQKHVLDDVCTSQDMSYCSY